MTPWGGKYLPQLYSANIANMTTALTFIAIIWFVFFLVMCFVKEDPNGPKNSWHAKFWIPLIIACVLVLPVWGLIAIFSGGGDSSETQAEEQKTVEFDSIRAWQSVQDDVKNQLKAPSTAKLSSYGNSTVKKHPTEPSTYVVRGYVDAENSFGAMLRQNYIATVVFFPNGGTYLTLDVQFIQ